MSRVASRWPSPTSGPVRWTAWPPSWYDGELERDARPQRRLLEEQADASGRGGGARRRSACARPSAGRRGRARPAAPRALQSATRRKSRPFRLSTARMLERLGAYGASTSSPASASSSRSRFRPVNIRLLIVPSGEPSRSASSRLREAAVVGELDRLALVGRELAQRLLDDLPLRAQPRLLVGRLAGGRRDVVERVGAAALLAADEVDRAAVDERQDPGATACRARRRNVPAERQTARNASCTASSASARSRTIRSASP